MDSSDPLSTLPYSGSSFGHLGLASNGTALMASNSTENSAFISILKKIYLLMPPTIGVTAVTGNILAFLVFVSKSLRRTSCSWYLAARSVADSAFMIFFFLNWFSSTTKLNFVHVNGICQIYVFSTYLFAFMSVWLTVVVTVENYIRICRPFSVQRFCNTLIARNAIIILFFVGVLLYNYQLWTTTVVQKAGNTTIEWCGPNEKFSEIAQGFFFLDTLITLVVPSVLIVVFMVAITFSLIKSLKRQSRLQGVRAAEVNGQAGGGGCGRARSRSSPQAKVTGMLFAVSFFFILLNGPSHTIRAYRAFVPVNKSGSQPNESYPGLEEQVQVFCEIIYYMYFAVNLIIYLTFGQSFRKQFKETFFFFCLHRSATPGCSEMTAMSSVRLEEENRNEDQAALLIEPNPAPNKENNNVCS